jgi:hypothetical protein
MSKKSKYWRDDLPIQGPIVKWEHLVSLNRIQGISNFRKFGLNEAVGTSYETIGSYNAQYTLPTAAQTLDVVSGSTEDAAEGTGALTMRIEGLDANYAEITEDVTLTGQTTATTTQSFLRVNAAYILTAGSTGSNVGVITVDQTTSGTVVAVISATYGEALQLIQTVPAGKYMILDHMTIGIDKGDRATVQFRYKIFGGAWRSALVETLYQNFASFSSSPGLTFPPKTDWEVRGIVRSGSGGVISSFVEGFLFDSGWYDDS